MYKRQLDDLITGWLTKDGEVENVSVDGDENYSADKWYSNDVEAVSYTHLYVYKRQPIAFPIIA